MDRASELFTRGKIGQYKNESQVKVAEFYQQIAWLYLRVDWIKISQVL